jgi:hypothetical protein
MSEQFLRDLAERFGLDVLKRITTGPATGGHFATFELSGVRVEDAWATVRAHGRGKDFDKLTRATNPEHAQFGLLFIECSSVWCESGQYVSDVG